MYFNSSDGMPFETCPRLAALTRRRVVHKDEDTRVKESG